MLWCKTALKDIGEALEFVQDIGLYPDRLEVKGFWTFKVWTEHGWVTFAQPIGKGVVAYTPRNYEVVEGLKTWKSPYSIEEVE